MEKDDRIYLDHILESFSKVVQYLEDSGYEAFLADEEKQDANIRKTEVAGEVTKRLSKELREKYYQSLTKRKKRQERKIHNYNYPCICNFFLGRVSFFY